LCHRVSPIARGFLKREQWIVYVADHRMGDHGIESFVGDIKEPCIAHKELDLLTNAFGRANSLRDL
jgi:hypothetical protein